MIFLGRFRDGLQRADALFPMRDNEQELVVLAGAALVHIMESPTSALATFAAMSLVAASAQNLRRPSAIPGIPELAARHISNGPNGEIGPKP